MTHVAISSSLAHANREEKRKKRKKKNKSTHRSGINLPPLAQIPPLRPRNINHAINDRMRDMHALRTHLPGQTLRHGAEGELHGGEGGEVGGTFDGGGGAGEDEGWRVGLLVGCWGGEEEREGGLGEVEGTFAGGGC